MYLYVYVTLCFYNLKCPKKRAFMRYEKLIANRFQALRKSKKMTIEEVASKSGYSTTFINYLLNGRRYPSLKSLEKFCVIFDVSMSDFFNFDNKSNYTNEIDNIISDLSTKDKKMVLEMLKTYCKRLKGNN